MPIIELNGTVPITVVVDTDRGQVLEVTCWDEESRLDRSADPLEQKARQVAEEQAWPAWKFGH